MLKQVGIVSLAFIVAIDGGCSRVASPPSPGEPEQAAVDKGRTVAEEVAAKWRGGMRKLDFGGEPVSDQTRDAENSGVLFDVIKSLPRAEQEKLIYYLTGKTTDGMTNLDWDMIEALVRVLATANDEKRLVGLLSRRCPRAMGGIPIEFDLVTRTMWLRNPILVLVSSYKDATNEEAKKTLLDALSSAFPSLRKQIPEDRQFVDACEKWYQENRERAVPNIDYVTYFEMGAFRARPEGVPPPDLFLVRGARGSRGAKM
jgi:hypothetical protein